MKSLSIIIPVYNEEKLLKRQVERILAGIESLYPEIQFEIILVENGSNDNTARIASKLAKDKRIQLVSVNRSSYGLAFKAGLLKAKFEVIFQFDIDFWDLEFIRQADKLLETYDFVIGSKNIDGARDLRPIKRRLLSRILEKAINLRFPVRISDTHGLKAIKKEIVGRYIKDIVCQNHFFDSELMIRMALDDHSFKEIPVNLKELRNSRFPFLVRLREVAGEFMTLLSLNLAPMEAKLPYAYRLQKAMVQYLVQLFM